MTEDQYLETVETLTRAQLRLKHELLAVVLSAGGSVVVSMETEDSLDQYELVRDPHFSEVLYKARKRDA